MKARVLITAAAITLTGLPALIQCGGEKEQTAPPKPVAAPAKPAEKSPAVCIWDGTAVREAPSRKGKYLSSVNLGEKLTYLGENAVDNEDPKKREYLKIKLSDGQEGWASVYGVAVKARGGAVLKKTAVYKRPDLLAKGDKMLKGMDFIAITDEKDDWLEVVGENKKNAGWIKKEFVTEDPDEVAAAVLTGKALKKAGENPEPEKIRAIIDASPYQNSYFIKILREKLNSAG